MHVRDKLRVDVDKQLLQIHLRLTCGPAARSPEEWRDLMLTDRRMKDTFCACQQVWDGRTP